jgi:hypothetical protein
MKLAQPWLKPLRKRLRHLTRRSAMTTANRAPQVSENVRTFKDYERGWAPVLAATERILKVEHSLARVIGRLSLGDAPERLPYEPMKFISSGTVIDISAQGYSGIYGDILLRTVMQMCRNGADNVVELGSGWGNYLFQTWLHGGPRDARYYACEYSENGRACTARIATVADETKIAPIFFDYHHPDYSAIEPGKKTVVYTSHSIEQIQTLKADVILGLLDLGEEVEGLHLEPVGWQVRHQRRQRLPEFSARHEGRCRKYQYNENLWSLLRSLPAAGKIRITDCVPDIIGMEYNPSTLIRWVKV